jgi:hypothetical protein
VNTNHVTWTFNWSGATWIKSPLCGADGKCGHWISDFKLTNRSIIATAGTEIAIFNWNGSVWTVAGDFNFVTLGSTEPKNCWAGQNFFVVQAKNNIYVIQNKGGVWVLASDFNPKKFSADIGMVVCGGNNFAVNVKGNNPYFGYAYFWDGSNWRNEGINKLGRTVVACGPDYVISTTARAGDYYYGIHCQSDTGWTRVWDYVSDHPQTMALSYAGIDFLDQIGGRSVQIASGTSIVSNMNGENMKFLNFSFSKKGPSGKYSKTVRNIAWPSFSEKTLIQSGNTMCITRKQYELWDRFYRKCWEMPWACTMVRNNCPFSPTICSSQDGQLQNAFVRVCGSYNSPDPYCDSSYDDLCFKPVNNFFEDFQNTTNILQKHYLCIHTSYGLSNCKKHYNSSCDGHNVSDFAADWTDTQWRSINPARLILLKPTTDIKFDIIEKIRRSTDAYYQFLVSERIIRSSVNNEMYRTAYTFDGLKYDNKLNIFRFTSCLDTLPGNTGTIRYTFFNDDTIQSGVTDYQDLDGRLYLIEKMKPGATADVISRKTIVYSIFRRSDWPAQVFDIQKINESEVVDGVSKTVITPTFDDLNGKPTLIQQGGGSAKWLTVTKEYAYHKYPLMDETHTHMLAQEASQKVYDGTAPSVNKLQSASATTWSNELGCGGWAPDKNYAWQANLSSNGIPDTTFADFDHMPDAPNPNWVLMNAVEKYDMMGRAIEISAPLDSGRRIFSASFFGHKGQLAIGGVKNAKRAESAIFTCDYDDQPAGVWFDEANGWEHGGTANNRLASPGHFGAKCVHVVNAYGPTNNIRITPGRDYVFAAWVKIMADTLKPKFAVGFYNGTNAAINPVAIGSWNSDNLKPDLQPEYRVGKWTYIEHKVLWSQVSKGLFSGHAIGEVQWYRIFLGCIPGERCDFFVDDIRFYPNDGQAASTYYDTTWQQPVTTAGVDAKPSQRITYDALGRPIQWHKYTADNHDVLQLAHEKTYHVVGFPPLPPYPPEYKSPADGAISEDSTITLKWQCEHPDGKDVEYDVYCGTHPDSLNKLETVSIPSYLKKVMRTEKYYWQIVARTVENGLTSIGPIWWFAAPYTVPHMPNCKQTYHIPHSTNWYLASIEYVPSPYNRKQTFEVWVDDDTIPSIKSDSCPCVGHSIWLISSYFAAKRTSGTWYVTADDGISKLRSATAFYNPLYDTIPPGPQCIPLP